jgi:anthranilate synthase/aminodeoxychorismate synthase-like glutamine amidotransferase
MILLLDHDDSFVHTLAGYLAIAGAEPLVRRDDAITMAEVVALAPDGIVLSPGPGAPAECTLARHIVRELGRTVPILGVCLGHQVIAEAHGATVRRAAHPRHGRVSSIRHDGRGVFRTLPSPLEATRYHSLAVAVETVPALLEVTAWSDDGEVMGLRHHEWPVEGVQFHPESILTEHGAGMIRNWLGTRDDGR